MNIHIFKANDKNDLKSKVQKFCDEGNYITKVKFEIFENNQKKLIVYYEDDKLNKQEIIVINLTVDGTINFLNNKILNETILCMDTMPYRVNGLMAIVVKSSST